MTKFHFNHQSYYALRDLKFKFLDSCRIFLFQWASTQGHWVGMLGLKQQLVIKFHLVNIMINGKHDFRVEFHGVIPISKNLKMQRKCQ